MAIQRVVKPTTRKGKRVLEARQPITIEGPKQTLVLHGRKTSDFIRLGLKDLYRLKKPDAKLLSRNNDITIFENASPVEELCRKYETSLFIMGSHSKKRPNNLIIGRMYNYSLLDMVELGLDSFQSLADFVGPKITLGTKPCLIFNGPAWDQMDELKHLKSMFVDLFHRENVENIRLQGLEHAISFTATADNKILLRSYKVLLKKSGCKTPRVELEEMGPHLDFTFRRSKLASEDLMKQACRKPKILKVAKRKNVSRDGLGTLHGRIHVGKQNITSLQTRKMKGLKKTAEEKRAEKKQRKRPLTAETNSTKPVASKKRKVE
ncbi:hypothetical protein PPYR_04228 [Photinus pyralis]|uniref:Ribosome production factor 2 homolog n=1 Tax=Photinus pyralis TaxID=7054 RepID=A0A1Y1KIV2_PHOPY|nr:ribosome production factor 2 homolog [Photinus pyralis]KAB0802042.1 hypothetical protein PPYR_04228 [Photinus pyralis]